MILLSDLGDLAMATSVITTTTTTATTDILTNIMTSTSSTAGGVEVTPAILPTGVAALPGICIVYDISYNYIVLNDFSAATRTSTETAAGMLAQIAVLLAGSKLTIK